MLSLFVRDARVQLKRLCQVMMNRVVSFVICLGLLIVDVRSEAVAEDVARPDFERDVLPIFEQHCLRCHGADKQESGLRLDRRFSLLKGGDWGEPSIIPGKPEASFLFRVVTGQAADLTMPPAGEPLGPEEIRTLRRWIEQGAAMPNDPLPQSSRVDHWSFQPVERPVSVPGDEHPIDALLRERLHAAGLDFSVRADRRTLIRRLFLVMLGLPPSPEQVAEFVQDRRPDAWPRLVDSVLANPHYGERWARHWLDLIRFGETHGFETNRERPHAWRYRDWVIQSFNADKPYDEFVRQQIAGDALGEPVATGFLVAGPHDLVKSPDINLTLMQRQDELSDLVNATGTAILGLTLGCARCHNHKFDPITQRDFYAVQAIFAGVQHGDRDLPRTLEQKQQLHTVERRISELERLLEPFLPQPAERALRKPVNFAHNIEQFDPVPARYVRFTVQRTTSAQPCLDELEVFSEGRNVALSSQGTLASSSSNLPGYEIHKLEHINDGKYGNSWSWISHEDGGGWVQLELPQVKTIDRIDWGRDREQRYQDRLAIEYDIAVSIDAVNWQTVASHRDRRPFGTDVAEPRYNFDQAPVDLAARGRGWLQELQSLQKQRGELSQPPKAYAGTFTQPEPTHRLYRGEPTSPREEVPPGTIEALGTLELQSHTPEQQRRVAFAKFLTDPQNPLTARVIVNRIWQHHFGTGIVPTSSDFGTNGVPPTHPELLDWLASELIENGWSLKQIHRQILLSHAWQQASTPDAQAHAVDATSALIWRFPPRRLEAEAIRDCLLAAAGVLDRRAGGPGFSGFEVEMENVRHFHPKTSYGPADWRRMIYMTKVRQEQDSVFGVFDCPDASQVIHNRSRSTTPLQALNLLNSTFVFQQSEMLSERLVREAGASPERQVQRAFEICFSRPPTDRELAGAMAFIAESGRVQFARAVLNANEFLFIP